jgi:pimeloyl-ACP methyl ester carboxylesterase
MSVNAPTAAIQVNGHQAAHAVAQPKNALATPILMLHGWGGSSSLMWGAAEALARLGWQCYIPDLPGFGESAPPASAWGVEEYARFVVGYMDAVGIERAHLIGHSFGGRLSIYLGANEAQRVEKVVLCNSAGIRKPPSGGLRLRLYKLARGALQRVGARQLAAALQKAYNDRYGSPDFRAATGVMRETLVRVVNQDLSGVALRLNRQTLIFWGDQDTDTPLWMGQKLEKLIPDAGLIIFEGVGHYSYLERQGEFVRIVDHFLRH